MSSSPSQFPPADGPTTPRMARCPTCSASSNPNKTTSNLVVCIDGTANKFGRDNTNVVRLLKAVDCDNKDPQFEQHVYYSSGIGTHPRIAPTGIFTRAKRALSDKLDMAIAWNVEETVKETYAWLAGRYRKGDQIYLFGFSRGAYQVRMLAAMIHEVGLLKILTEKQIGTAYDRFESVLSHKPNANGMAEEFRAAFSWKHARVHFIGVWDTVSSVGFVRGDVRLSASSAAAHACYIRHALALDECRVKFMPEYFLGMNSSDFHNAAKDSQLGFGGMEASDEREIAPEATIDNASLSTSEESTNTSSDGIDLEYRRRTAAERVPPAAISCTKSGTDECADGKTADIKEVWFAGCHADVGGMRRPGKLNHAGDVSLVWMRCEAGTSGLCLKAEDVHWTAEDLDSGTTNSMSFFWKVVEILPIRHQVSFSGPGGNARRPHLFEPRRIIPKQKIHASVQFANTYVPKATFGNGFGNPLETVGLIPSREDVWENATIGHKAYAMLLDNFTKTQGTTPFYLHRLLFLLRSTGGQWPIMDVSEQQEFLTDLISTRSGLVRLLAMAAYSEATDSSSGLEDTIQKVILVEAGQSLVGFIKPDQPDWPRAVALLRPLAKHQVLRDSILTAEVTDGFLELLDHVISVPGEHFVHVMDALSSLVELHPGSITGKLFQSPSGSSRSRISLLLDTIDPYHFTAVLRVLVVLTGKDSSPYDKLCGVNDDSRGNPLDQGIPDIFIKQLQFKDSALLAAYALTKCLTHEIFSTPIKEDAFLAGYIFNMIKLDYFDEAIGMTEGFTILEDLLRYDELRHKILKYDIAELLGDKLGAGKPAEKHMTLVYLNIFRIHSDGEDSLTPKLVERGLSHLKTNQWKTQKAGVIILGSLAQTWFGIDALKQAIPHVINMLLPNDESDSDQAAPSNQSKLPSALFGPACVLRFMAEHETLRKEIPRTSEYWNLWFRYLLGEFLDAKETPLWQVKTPTRDDVLDMIDQTIETLEDNDVKGSMNPRFVLPHIWHLDRIANVARYGAVGAIVGPPAIAGAGVLVVIGAITVAPVVVSRKVTEWFGRRQRLHRQRAIMNSIGKDSSPAPGNART